MKFEIDIADVLKVKDIEISELLIEVYVDGGFIEPKEATLLFSANSVNQRGVLIAAREKLYSKLAGVIIFVPPNSLSRRLAKNNEAEIHLLGVKPEYRRCGLGRMLVGSAIKLAKSIGCSKIILWTQTKMKPAQKLYESAGFIHTNDINRNGRKFKIYEMMLHTE